jgi:hypothetical protein
VEFPGRKIPLPCLRISLKKNPSPLSQNFLEEKSLSPVSEHLLRKNYLLYLRMSLIKIPPSSL